MPPPQITPLKIPYILYPACCSAQRAYHARPSILSPKNMVYPCLGTSLDLVHVNSLEGSSAYPKLLRRQVYWLGSYGLFHAHKFVEARGHGLARAPYHAVFPAICVDGHHGACR